MELRFSVLQPEETLKTKLKGAVIGVGYLGRFHAQKIKASGQAELVGVFDFHKPQAEKISAELGVKSYLSMNDVASEVDFVTVAASTQAHYEIAEFFLNKNIPVLVEKPIAATAELGAKLCDLAEKNHVIFSVGHIERFNPAYDYLRQNSHKIKYLELNRLAPFRTRGSDVSVLHDLMIHDLDLVNYIFKQKIKSIIPFGQKMIRPTIDDVSVLLTLESGIQVHIQNSRLTPQIVRNYRAVMDDRVILMNTATSEADVLLPDETQPDLHKVEKWVVGKVDALGLEIEHFISAVKKEKPVAITGREATAALKTIEEIVSQIEGV